MSVSRWVRTTAVLVLCAWAWAWGAQPSHAKPGHGQGRGHGQPELRHSVSATVALPAARADVLILCTDGQCETVTVGAATAKTLALVLRHAGSPSDPLPDTVVVAGKPLPTSAAACAGRLGIAVTLDKTAGTARELVVQVLVDGSPVSSRTSTGIDGQRSRSTSVCVPAA